MGFLVLTALLLTGHTILPISRTATPDSLKRQAASLSAQGNLDSALSLVEKSASSLPDVWTGLLRGKLELHGDSARKAFESAVKDSTHGDAPRGEALFRLGQYHYAAGHYRLAIPQFRQYLSRYPKGPLRDPAAYWMAHACLQFFQQQPARRDYLDTGLHYLDRLELRSRPKGYYLPLALAAQARLLLARGKANDTNAAITVLVEARRKAPREEIPATLLLSSQAMPRSKADTGRIWQDSILWEYPSSPEASLWMSRISIPRQNPVATERVATKKDSIPASRYTLQLGNFSLSRNAEEMRKSLASKGIRVWVEQNASGENRRYRVLHGIYPDVNSARKEGERVFKPLTYPFQVIPLTP